MISSRSHLAARLLSRRAARSFSSKAFASDNSSYATMVAAGVATAVVVYNFDSEKTLLAARIPSSGDIISAGTPIQEPGTGILFPPLCSGLYFTGCGYRVKYGFIKGKVIYRPC